MNMEEIKIESECVYDGAIVCVSRDTVRLPDQTTAFREVIDHNGGSCVVAVTPEKKLLMVRQYRYGAGQVMWELPAGKLEKGEDPMVCAARELEEETGYKATELVSIGSFHPTPAYCRERIFMYYAKGLSLSRQQLDHGEFLEVGEIPFDRALDMVKTGEITDAKTVIAILKVKEMFA